MKKLKKIETLFLIIFIILSSFSNAFAVDLKTILEVVQISSETKYLENDQGYISKTIVNSDEENGEVTVEVKVSNTKKGTEKNNETEIFLVIDNSPSMDFVTSDGRTRKEIIINASKNLVNSIFTNTENVKIGIVDFHGKNGWFESAGIENANLTQKLTEDKQAILTKLDQLNQSKTVGGTNIDAGLQKANSNFSESCKNRVIILLSDGVPNADVNGNDSGNNVTDETSIKVQENTRNTLIRLSQSGVNIISMMTGLSESDGHTDKNGNDYGEINIEEELKAVERIFGTMDKPTVGKYYLVKSANVENIIQNDILNNVMEIVQNPIYSVKIVDYFPEDITENFDFSYVGIPSIGTVSDSIDTENNTIECDIGSLKGDEVATLRYKLKIKDMKNEELLNKTISTNEKVVLTYKDTDDKDYTVTLSSSPKIQLSEVEEKPNEPVEPQKPAEPIPPKQEDDDSSIAPIVIPKAGASITILLVIVILIVIGVVILKKYNKFRDIK